MLLIHYIFVFITGAVTGSFLNVIIYRCPRHESIITPHSFCPKCRQPIKFHDNIPIVSYLWLRGKCRHCMTRIPLRYLLVESITPVLFLIIFYRFQYTSEFLFYTAFVSLLLVFSFIDLEFRIIPNKILLPGFVMGFLGLYFLSPREISNHIAGLLVIALSMLALAWFGQLIFQKESMGGGDIKLAALIGLILGIRDTFFSLFTAFFIATMISIFLLKIKRSKLDSQIPFAPFLAIGVVINLFYGHEILRWYSNLISKLIQ